MSELRVFLKAEWRSLVMLNYAVDPGLLRARAPIGTTLDFFEGKTYVSLVGFRFLETRVLGVAVPFHCNFDEVNLRFYVRRCEGGTVRRGTVFIREIVPRHAIATIARLAYNEPYIALPMKHTISEAGAEYEWCVNGRWNRVYAEREGAPSLPAEGSQQQFIAEHYWGYTARRHGGCQEYRVEHEPWRVWSASHAGFEGDATELYGADLAAVLNRPSDSALIAEGSPVSVYEGRRIV